MSFMERFPIFLISSFYHTKRTQRVPFVGGMTVEQGVSKLTYFICKKKYIYIYFYPKNSNKDKGQHVSARTRMRCLGKEIPKPNWIQNPVLDSDWPYCYSRLLTGSSLDPKCINKTSLLSSRPALIIDHAHSQVAWVDAQVEGNTPHHYQTQLETWKVK